MRCFQSLTGCFLKLWHQLTGKNWLWEFTEVEFQQPGYYSNIIFHQIHASPLIVQSFQLFYPGLDAGDSINPWSCKTCVWIFKPKNTIFFLTQYLLYYTILYKQNASYRALCIVKIHSEMNETIRHILSML